ncbi:MAG: DMT family transporter [Acidimicrobiia bacterium]
MQQPASADRDPDARAARGVVLSLLAASLWGVSGAIAAGAFSSVSPFRVSQGRFVVAALVLVPYAVWRGARVPQGEATPLLVFGINMALVTGAFYTSIDRLGVGPGATIQFLGPILVLFWMKYRQKRRVSDVVWVAAVLALIGTAFLTQAWDSASLDMLGLLAGLAAAVLFASYLLIGEALSHRVGPMTAVTGGVVVAAAFWLLAVPFWQQTYALSADVWAALLWVGIAGTALPFLAELAALRYVASGVVGVIATVEPVIAAIAAWVLLEQILEPIQIIGGLLVIAAVASVQRWGLPQIEVPIDAGR